MATETGAPSAAHLEFAAPRNYLGLPDELSALETSRVVVLPVPYDRTTSYMPGARFGPRAVMDASRNLETYDDELDCHVRIGRIGSPRGYT